MSAETFTCGHCHFEFNKGVTACQGCLGTVIWGATQQEMHQSGQFMAIVGAVLGALLMFGLPAALNKYLGTDLTLGYGFGFGALIPVGITGLIGYFWGSNKAAKEHRGKCRTFR